MDTAIAGAICENADDFKPDYDMGQGSTCFMGALNSQIDKKDCAGRKKDSVMSLATAGCCGPARKSACGVASAPGAQPAQPTPHGDLPTCHTDGTVTPWPKDQTKELSSRCNCGSGVCYALGSCNVKALEKKNERPTSETACTCVPSDTHFCYAQKKDDEITTMPYRFGCFDNGGGGSIDLACAVEGADIVATHFAEAGCKAGSEISSTDDRKNPETVGPEWEVQFVDSSNSTSSSSSSSSSSSGTTCSAAEITACKFLLS